MAKPVLIYFLLICTFLLLPPLTYSASPTGSLEVSPVFLEVELVRPDDIKRIVFSYKNNSQKPISLEIFPIDFRQTDLTGAINFLGAESGSFSYSLASFLSFES